MSEEVVELKTFLNKDQFLCFLKADSYHDFSSSARTNDKDLRPLLDVVYNNYILNKYKDFNTDYKDTYYDTINNDQTAKKTIHKLIEDNNLPILVPIIDDEVLILEDVYKHYNEILNIEQNFKKEILFKKNDKKILPIIIDIYKSNNERKIRNT